MKPFAILCLGLFILTARLRAQEEYLTLNAKQSRDIALSTRAKGQAGSSFDFRVTSTDRSFNYKLRATWMTPEVIRANARLLQLSQRLSEEQTSALVAEAEAIDAAIVLVEIDPREGSGVVPRDWIAVLQPRAPHAPRGVRGLISPQFRQIPALNSAASRDYSYDVFWVAFPYLTPEGDPLFSPEDREAELIVRIYDKTGTVRWPIPNSVRQLMKPGK